MSTKGTLSINSENIFPIIKKWLYSDHDIFIRELISNSSDAILKLKKLSSLGEAESLADEDFEIRVLLDEEEKTITISDNGLGMTEDEIKKYINEIAFSGAEDFLEQYKDKMDEEEIIGHFGLGFYSSFMVADRVEIDTLSYKDDAKPARWSCDGGTDFEITSGSLTSRGTDVILHVNDDGKEFLNEYVLKDKIKKYCNFMPTPIYFGDEEKPLNNPTPLYTKMPTECTHEEYIEFYHETFSDPNDPLFWIHLNMDYPFRLKGILYFPKLQHEFETIEGKIKLYNNQVFVAENMKEVIPEFLLLLKGVIDCPDLPLNVSRSFLQNDGFVKKVSDYITRKVADKLNSLYKREREDYISFWDDISPFVKYGCIREAKFLDRVKKSIIYKTTSDDYITLEEYLERNKDKHKDKVFYVSDKVQQSQYINLLKDNDLEAIYLTHSIDNAFMSHIEMHNQDVNFTRVDSDLSSALKGDKVDDETKDKLKEIFTKALDKDNIKIEVENLKSSSISGMILLSEEGRRMKEMMEMYGMEDQVPSPETEETLVLNKTNPLIKLIMDNKDEEITKILSEQVYDLAMLSHKTLKPDEMTKFVNRSNKILEILASK